VRGTVLADSARHARDQLRERGIVVQGIAVQQHAASDTARLQWGNIGSRAANQHWGLAAHELSMLLSAGIPLLESLDTLVEQHSGKLQTALLKLRDQVETGSSLAAAMELQPEIFDAASIRLVEVGENAGTLDVMLSEVADYKLALSEFRDRVTTALLYPAFLACFGVVAMVFLMTFVMPPLLESLEETLTELPWPTRVAKTLSELLLSYGWWILVVCCAGVGAFVFAIRTERGKRFGDAMLLKVPVVGSLLLKQSIARAAMIVGLLSRSGILLTHSLQLAARSTDNLVVRDALEKAESDITAGEDIGVSLAKSGLFPPLAVRFFSVGQETGKLDEMLHKLAVDYNKQVATASARITAIIEPVMILVLAVAVGFLLVATVLPILEAGNVS
jgi:type II secretory pathway component PulF